MAKQYGWKDVSIVVLGRTIEGITDVKVSRKTVKERQYGRGNKPQAILSGNEEVSGAITLLQDELEAINLAIQAAQPGLDITKVSVDIVINYENTEGVSTTDIVVGAQFEEYEKALSQGDTKMQIEMPFMAKDFKEGV
jgi:hypothetical protein